MGMKIKKLTMSAAVMGVAVALGACAGAKKTVKDDAAAKTASSSEPRIAGAQYAATPELKTVHFDYDRDELTAHNRAVLKENAAAIKENSAWEVLVEGHCDERGTAPYNLALGQKRAKSVRDYYMMLGVPGGRVATLSYGTERPECSESTEACWSKNRRAQSKIKIAIAGGIPAGAKRHE